MHSVCNDMDGNSLTSFDCVVYEFIYMWNWSSQYVNDDIFLLSGLLVSLTN